MNPIQITGKILEVSGDIYEGKPWAKAIIRSEQVDDNKLITYTIDTSSLKKEDLEEYLDQVVTVEAVISKGFKNVAVLKLVGIVA